MAVPGSGAQVPGTVHVIVTCTNRKTRPIPAQLRLGSVPDGDTAHRAQVWISRLATENGSSTVAARDLYAGEHWVIACGLPRLNGRGRTRLWACSAGYGLIPAEAQLRPYAATFASREADSVSGEGNRWWRTLSEWEGPRPAGPRSIEALATANPGAVFVIALSAPYLNACRDDIATASECVADPDRFMVICVGARRPGRLAELMLPADARLQACLGGTRQALNARMAAHLLASGVLSRAEASQHLAQLLAKQRPIPRYERKKLTDEEVLALIAGGLARSPGASASRLLREFRDAGYACEQGRFGQLHRSLVEKRS